MRRLFPLAGLLLLAACGSVTPLPTPRLPPPSPPASPAPSPAGPPTHGLNELVRVAGWEMAVAAVERPGTRLIWSTEGLASVAAGTWLVIAFDLKNTGAAPEAVHSPDFRLEAPGGRVYRTAADTGAYAYSAFRGGRTLGGEVPPEATARYYLAFDVPAAATGLQLVFARATLPRFAVGNAAP